MEENHDENMEEGSLDTSWMNEVKKELSINTNYNKEPCAQINTYFIFVDGDNNIHKVSSDKEKLVIGEGNTSIITKERLLQIIENKKRENPKTKYRLANILLYCNEIEPGEIRNYAKNENMEEISNKALKVLSIFNDVVVHPSIFIFHSINAVYFIFKQLKNKNRAKVNNNPGVVANKIKSILKVKTKHAKSKLEGGEHNITKKVSFQDESSPEVSNDSVKMNTTKKNREDEGSDEWGDEVGGNGVYGVADEGGGNGDDGLNKNNKTRKL